MADQPLVVIPVLFGLSLLAAILLFKFFKSTALIKTKEYRAGGAIGGFIIVFLMLYASYMKISDQQVAAYKKQVNDQAARIERLKSRLRSVEFSGFVSPPSNDTRVIVVPADAQSNLAHDGRFDLSANCGDRKRALRVYILSNGQFTEYTIPKCEAVSNLKYSISQ